MKIILDSNIIIHLNKGECLYILKKVYTNYRFAIIKKILDTEFRRPNRTREDLERYNEAMKLVEVITWEPTVYEEIELYAELTDKHGVGESLCMVYCKFFPNIIASCDLKAIKEFCINNSITYITTEDILHEAYVKKIIDEKECNSIIAKIHEKGSNLTIKNISEYKIRQILI